MNSTKLNINSGSECEGMLEPGIKINNPAIWKLIYEAGNRAYK